MKLYTRRINIIFFLASFLFFSIYVFSQKEQSIHKKYFSDEYYLFETQANLNGQKTNLTIDTGATFSSIQDVFAEELLEMGLISIEDISPTKQRVFGVTGNETTLLSVNIDEFSIQNKKIKNVKFLISKDDKIPNIIGINILEKLSKFTLDFDDLTLKFY